MQIIYRVVYFGPNRQGDRQLHTEYPSYRSDEEAVTETKAKHGDNLFSLYRMERLDISGLNSV